MSKTIIERMCAIVDKMRDKDDRSVLSMDSIDKAATDIRALSSLLGMSRMEVVLLTAIVQRSSRRSLGGDDIAEFLGLEYIHFLTFVKEMESLKRKGYILVDSEEHIVMPKEVLQSLRQNKPVKPEPITGLDTLAILMRIKRIINIRENDNCTTGDAIREMELLLEQNPDTSIAKEYSKYSRRIGFEYDPEKMVLFGLIYRYHFKDDDMVGWHDFTNCFADYEIEPLQAEYRREQMILQRLGVIEYADEDGVRTKDYFRIKDEIKDAIFTDIGGIRKTTKKARVTASRLLEAKDIAARRKVPRVSRPHPALLQARRNVPALLPVPRLHRAAPRQHRVQPEPLRLRGVVPHSGHHRARRPPHLWPRLARGPGPPLRASQPPRHHPHSQRCRRRFRSYPAGGVAGTGCFGQGPGSLWARSHLRWLTLPSNSRLEGPQRAFHWARSGR